MKKWTKYINNIIYNKKIAFIMLTILTLGVISGSIFLILINKNDQTIVIDQIKDFFTNINNNNLNYMQSLKNSIIINYLFIILIWFFGITVIGLIINLILTYLRGFLIGFTISSIILTYKAVGIIASFIYILPAQLFNIFITMIIGTYSLIFSYNLIKKIKNNKNIPNITILKYFYILIICLVLSLISSLFEVYVYPYLIKIVIKLFI